MLRNADAASRNVTWKQRRRASSPREFLRLESPQRISLMSTVPSRLLSNRSNTRGASGISASIFIAFRTCSNSSSLAFSPSAHLHQEDLLRSSVQSTKHIRCPMKKVSELCKFLFYQGLGLLKFSRQEKKKNATSVFLKHDTPNVTHHDSRILHLSIIAGHFLVPSMDYFIAK